MKAHVTTNGDNDRAPDGLRYVQHWQLYVDDEFIADASSRRMGELFERIADKINGTLPEGLQ